MRAWYFHEYTMCNRAISPILLVSTHTKTMLNLGTGEDTQELVS